MVYDAVVLAGGDLKGITGEKAEARGLIEIKNKPMLEYIIDALNSSSLIDKIVVVVPAKVEMGKLANKVSGVVKSDGTLTQNLYRGIEYLKTTNMVLVLSSDIPLITSEAIDDFFKECESKKAQVCYSVVSKEAIEEKFGNSRRTYVKLRDGAFTGGNVFLFDPKVVKNNIGLIEEAYEARKSPFKLARMMGLKFIFKFLFRQLTIEELEERISSLIKAEGKAVVTAYPEIGMDVDKNSDLELARKMLQ